MYALYTPKPGHGKRKRGQPRLNYVDYVARLINNDEPPTVDEIRKTAADGKRCNTHAPGEKARLIEIKDQRVTNIGVHLLISCTIFAAPTIRKLPVAALFGIFLYFGTVSISGTQLFSRIKMAFIPTKYYSNIGYLRRVYITTLII
ncbi:unnamed protein product [Rotaria sp. Silwood2]|nr:unnamed protein product [Rotaria sp. Silwood2]CAF2884100.1 unnamed protein product [Rotaria sp. Silwood2]CAF4101451.1 unnamed protein product [Rotaria sp. Silwood2]CAF4134430.1 unnamed protein product [Rotaria sp. Silwood2]CAF4145457.1 unnamed protein product [Rotaria sp. Silwood2]